MDRAEENIEQFDTGKCGPDGGEEVYEEDQRLLTDAHVGEVGTVIS